MSSPHHSKTLKNKITACARALNRVTLVMGTQDQDQESAKTSEEKENGRKVPLISLPGIDRIQNPNYNKVGKRLWSLVLLLCAVGCCYQVVDCFTQYFAGEAAIAANFEVVDHIPIPELLFCPADLIGRNVLTGQLRLKYMELFNSSAEDVYFSDFLRIPNVTVASLWNLNGFKPEDIKVEVKCSPMKNDDSCVQILVKSLNTSCGTCVLVSFDRKIQLKESSISVQIGYPPIPKSWIKLHLHSRFTLTQFDSNPVYQRIGDGTPTLPTVFCLRIKIATEKIINLNLPNKPCMDSKAVENCIDNCIENQLYSSMPCRLPYLLNHSLPLCKDPKSFNKSMAIATRVLQRKVDCEISCPRKCEEFIIISSLDFYPPTRNYTVVELIVDAKRMMVIREVYWYQLSSLFSDVGGFLGIFLGICLLNFFEGINVLTYKIKVLCEENVRNMNPHSRETPPRHMERTRDNKQVLTENNRVRVKHTRGRKENEEDSTFLISITGLDRILDASVEIRRKILWSCCLTLAFATWLYQLFTTISDFNEALPDIMIDYERNRSLKFPTFTICPGEPFTYAKDIEVYKEHYISEFNRTDMNISDVPLSELLNVPELNVSQLWKIIRPKKLMLTLIKYERAFGITSNISYSPPVQIYKETIYASCISVTAPEMLLYEGFATNEFLVIPLVHEIGHPNNFKLFIHDDYDEINFMDPALGRPLLPPTGFVLIGVKKIERLHHRRRPCASKAAVVRCQIECFNKMLEQSSVNCSLPFMKRFPKPICSSSADFNRSMEISKMVLKTFMKENNCSCPKPLEEYLFDTEIGQYPGRSRFPIKTISLVIIFKSNFWIVLKDYYKVGVNGIFANVCGSLGLYLGLCIPSIVEILEFCIFVLKSKTKTVVRPFSE